MHRLQQRQVLPWPKGDVTGNRQLTANDATQILKQTAGLLSVYNPLPFCESDTTCNGTISTLDAAQIPEYRNGLISSLRDAVGAVAPLWIQRVVRNRSTRVFHFFNFVEWILQASAPKSGEGGYHRMDTIGRYTQVSHVAGGGMGKIYRGYDSAICRTAALKTVALEKVGAVCRENLVKRLRGEIRIAYRKFDAPAFAQPTFGGPGNPDRGPPSRVKWSSVYFICASEGSLIACRLASGLEITLLRPLCGLVRLKHETCAVPGEVASG